MVLVCVSFHAGGNQYLVGQSEGEALLGEKGAYPIPIICICALVFVYLHLYLQQYLQLYLFILINI